MKTREHRPIPYERIAKMLDAGKNTTQIAKAIGRFDAKAEDPTKSTRAILSRMRTEGFEQDGKTVHLKARFRGANGTAKKTTKKVAKKAQPKKAKTTGASKPSVLVLNVEGKNLVIEAPKRKNVLSIAKLNTALNKAGYAVVEQVAEALPADIPAAPDAPIEDAGTGTETNEVAAA